MASRDQTVYVIHVSWSDGSVNVVYRRYSNFFDFQVKLLSLFPEEGGSRNPSQRMIPFLPGKKLFGRSQVRDVASKRLGQLNEYCQLLVRLPPKVSESDAVLQFFTPTAEDIKPIFDSDDTKKGKEIDVISDPIQPDPYIVIADYKKKQKNEVDLFRGDNVEVFEKNDNGWWFINSRDNQGWAPATFLGTPDGDEQEDTIIESEEHYITNSSYKAQQEDEVSFETGVIMLVKKKSLDGWWMVSYQDKVGWVPATFLQVYSGPVDVAASAPTQRIGNVMNLSDIKDAAKRSPLNPRKDDTNVQGTESKPTPPRRNTVRPAKQKSRERTVRTGATRKPKPVKKTVVEHFTVADFSDNAGDSISFQSGQKVQVIQENDTGWWLVKIGDREGWAPSTFIEAREETVAGARPRPLRPETLDEETGESNAPRSARPPAPAARKTPDAHLGSSGAPRPVPKPAGLGGSDHVSAFRPVPVPGGNQGRPLPVAPALKHVLQAKHKSSPPQSGGGTDILKNAHAKLKPAGNGVGQGRPPPVNRNSKPNFDTNGSPAVNRLSSSSSNTQVNDLKNKFQALNPPSASRGPVKTKPSYVTTADFDNSDDDGLSFREGAEVEVLEENESGWWLVCINGQEGWAPSTYLEKC